MGQTPANPGRRAFLRGRSQPQTVMRPPWSQPERVFVDLCQTCGACVSACPGQVLRVGAGGFPEVDFSAGECTFCKACVTVCEPQALTLSRPQPWAWRASIGADCLTAQGVHCQSCRDVCPPSAIRFASPSAVPRPTLDTELCTACGACLRACPTRAITLRQTEAEAPA